MSSGGVHRRSRSNVVYDAGANVAAKRKFAAIKCFVSDVQLALAGDNRTSDCICSEKFNDDDNRASLGLRPPRSHRNSTTVSNPAHFGFNNPSADIGAETVPEWPPATWF